MNSIYLHLNFFKPINSEYITRLIFEIVQIDTLMLYHVTIHLNIQTRMVLEKDIINTVTK